NEVEDTCVWPLVTDGTFSVNDARCIIDSKPPLLAHFFDEQAVNDQSPFAWRSVSVHGTSFNKPFQILGKIVKLLNYLSMIRIMRHV
ncbi:hypothetical protein Tco_0864782, partial [Tanacetum coccineum]